MAVPHSNTLQTSVTSGTPLTLELPVPYRGSLTRIVVKQTSGTLAGYTIDLYDCDPAALPDSDDAEIHKIFSTKTVAAAASTSADYTTVTAYENQDELDDTSKRKLGKLYMIFTVAGTGAKPFHVGYTTTSDI
jgi:hypothetical protein